MVRKTCFETWAHCLWEVHGQIGLAEAARIAPQLLLIITQFIQHLFYLAIQVKPSLCRGFFEGVIAARQ